MYTDCMQQSKENIAPVIIDTLKLPIHAAAEKIILDCDLTYLTPEEVINSIKSFRETRKGLEMCAETIATIYRRKSMEEDNMKIGDLGGDDLSGILGNMNNGIWGRFRP